MEALEHEESPEIEDAALEAGFGGETIEEPEEVTATEEAEESTTEEVEPVQEQVEAPLTRAELQAIEARSLALEAQITRVHDKAFGKIGELQQKIEAIKTRTTGLSPRAKERLAGEFPELAEMLFDGADEPEPPQRPAQQDDVLVKIRAEREQEKQEIERRLLKRDHRDWETVVASSTFKGWVGTLPPSEQQTLTNSWDADFVSAKLGEFKQWNAAQQAAAEEKETTKNKRLENAVTPRGVRGKSPGHDIDDEEAAMIKAFSG